MDVMDKFNFLPVPDAELFKHCDRLPHIPVAVNVYAGLSAFSPVSYTHLEGGGARGQNGVSAVVPGQDVTGGDDGEAVSYTHLDVYKRQEQKDLTLVQEGNGRYDNGFGNRVKKCPNCGYETQEDFEFCPKCGTRF